MSERLVDTLSSAKYLDNIMEGPVIGHTSHGIKLTTQKAGCNREESTESEFASRNLVHGGEAVVLKEMAVFKILF